MRIELAIKADKLVVRLWQDGLDDGGRDIAILVSEAEMPARKIVQAARTAPRAQREFGD